MTLAIMEQADGVAVITLNRPEAMNALSRQLRIDLAAAIRAATASPDVRVIVLTGAGERAFSAGVDLKELAAGGFAGQPRPEDDPLVAMAACPTPVIAAINGVAITGGLELALACDMLLASENARFADTHVRVGIMPGWGLSQRLSRLIGLSRAKEMSLSGNFVDAQTALSWGLVNRVVPPAELMPAARQLAADIAGCAPAYVARYKALIDDGYALPFGEGMKLETARAEAENPGGFDRDGFKDQRTAIQARGRAQAQTPD
jgi:enoyl-CoA hydratase